jgi:hypothetical protein
MTEEKEKIPNTDSDDLSIINVVNCDEQMLYALGSFVFLYLG